MRIAIMVDTLEVGGAERQAILCVSELRKLGHSADLIHYHPQVDYVQMLERLHIKPIYVPGATFVQRCRNLRRLFRERNYDVVHGFKMAAEVYAAVAGTWAGVPHRFGSFRSVYTLGPQFCLVHFVVDKFLDGWVVNSRCGADSMARKTRIARRKIGILHNGLCSEMFSNRPSCVGAKRSLGIAENSLVITMVARLEAEKNHRMLIDAAKRVIGENPNARFLVVGKGSLSVSLKEYSSGQGLSEKVLFLGERSDVAEILAGTDISALTSDYEGLPNAVIEAMAAGKPIVCTAYKGYEEIMSHESTALISPCGDAGAFANNILRLIRDEPLRQRLSDNAFQYAQGHFSPQAMARNLELIYSRGTANLEQHPQLISTSAC
jgi:glycosyltransferase involved in cell wall biosynthesis